MSGPAIRTPNTIVKPIASPAILSNAPFASTAVAKTTITRKKVQTASIVTALPGSITEFTLGAP